MSPAPLLDRYQRVTRPTTVTLHQPTEGGAVLTHTGRLLGAMYARGALHHVRVALEGGVVLLAPPAWVARDSRCYVAIAGLDIPDEWNDGSMWVPAIEALTRLWADRREPVA